MKEFKHNIGDHQDRWSALTDEYLRETSSHVRVYDYPDEERVCVYDDEGDMRPEVRDSFERALEKYADAWANLAKR